MYHQDNESRFVNIGFVNIGFVYIGFVIIGYVNIGFVCIAFEKHGLLLSQYGWHLKNNGNLYRVRGSIMFPGKGLGLGFSLSGPFGVWGTGSGPVGIGGFFDCVFTVVRRCRPFG